MELKKHSKELSERLNLLNPSADAELARELIELHEEKCRVCQDDRLGCTLRPACKNRNFLNVLIDLGVDPQDLPSFCYSQYLEQIRRFVLEDKGTNMDDRHMPIHGLLSALRMSSIRQFTSRLRKIRKKMSVVRKHDLLLVALDDLLFHFDFGRGIVTMNPVHKSIESFETLSMYVELFSQHYGVTADAKDFTQDWWGVLVIVPGVKTGAIRRVLKESVSQSFESVSVSSTDEGVEVLLEIVGDGTRVPVEVGDIRQVFVAVSQAMASK